MDDFHRMVAEFMCEMGFDAKYVKKSNPIPNDTNGSVTYTTEEIDVRAIKMDVFGNTAGVRGRMGTLIQEADQVLYIQPTEQVDRFSDPLFVNPTTDRVKIKGVDWKVVALKEYNPSADNCVLYELYIKR